LFIDHVRAVAARLRDDPDPYAVPAALLHDSIEKTPLSWDDLRAAGADSRLLAIVDALTERDGEPIAAYLARCAPDPLALRIKRYDLTDKLSRPAPRAMSAGEARVLRDHARRAAGSGRTSITSRSSTR
jgi:hypothetical protein